MTESLHEKLLKEGFKVEATFSQFSVGNGFLEAYLSDRRDCKPIALLQARFVPEVQKEYKCDPEGYIFYAK